MFFFKCTFNFFMPDCELIIQYISNFFVEFLLRIDDPNKKVFL